MQPVCASTAAVHTLAAAVPKNPTQPHCPPACSYTPALLPEYTDATTYKNAAPLTSCIDTRLTAAQKTACLTCLAIRDERRCLAQVGCAAWNLLQIEVQHGLLPCAHEALPGMPMGS